MESIAGIVVGFALTTLVGGWWAARLQERSWNRQNDVRLREEEHERASGACQELMGLLDRRLYRMQRLLWAATAAGRPELDRRRQDYVDVLLEWNEHLNTNLALVGAFFGDTARVRLDGLYEDFKRVGQHVEAVVRASLAGEDTAELAQQVALEFEGREVGSLNDRVYRFGLLLMGQLRDGQVGRYAPHLASPTVTDSKKPAGP